MQGILDFIKREPAILVTVAAAILGLATAFGLHLSADQNAAIAAVLTVIAGIIVRANVTPVAAPPAIPKAA